jgi:hypothetical protein
LRRSRKKSESRWEKVESRKVQIGANAFRRLVTDPARKTTFSPLLALLLYFLLSSSSAGQFYFLLTTLLSETVYQKSVDFADDVCSATEQFQRGYGFLVDLRP